MNRSDLPMPAQLKLSLLERVADDAEVLARAVRDDFTKLTILKDRLINQRDSSSDPDESPLNEQIAALDAERERLRDVQAARMDRARQTRQLVVQVNDWLALLKPNSKWEMAPPPDENLTALGLDDIRQRIDALIIEREQIEAAPLPLDELKEKIGALVDDLERKAKPKIRIERGKCEILWPSPPSGQTALSPVPAAAAFLLAWYSPRGLYDALVEEVTAALGDGVRTYGTQERAERLAQIEDELLALQYAEDVVIDDRVDVMRRPYANPLAVLGIRPVSGAIKQAA
ncbi:MAG: hypothetical protein AB7O60_03660 [Variibacter sp.]